VHQVRPVTWHDARVTNPENPSAHDPWAQRPPAQPAPGQPPYGQPAPPYIQPPYGQPTYGQPQYGPVGAYGQPHIGYDPAAPYGRHPITGEPYSDKQKIVAGLPQLFLGGFGAGRFYLGHNGIAVAQLLTCGGCGIWALIDGILMLMGNVRDAQGRPLRD
jgi:hypothetical protein